jgi:hypothetical protein
MGGDENATKYEICDFSLSLWYMILRCEKNSQQTKLQVLLGSGSICSEIFKKLAASCKLLPTQDMMVMNSRISDDDDDVNSQLHKRLTEASIKEAQLISEKRILELRVAELRLAYDQMQQALVDAASKALSYRQDILEENIRLTYAVQLAEQDRMTYVQSLMPLLTEFELQPPVLDAHSMVSYIKVSFITISLLIRESKISDEPAAPPRSANRCF